MTNEQAKTLAQKALSARRFYHTENVAAAARSLASRWGADPDKAELAGWLHDIVKERGREDLLQLLRQDAIMAGSTERRPFPVWHGPAAAIYARHQLGVEDEEVLSAIACHTTGKQDMALLDKVLFLADATSAERTTPRVEEIRRLAEEDLDEAIVASMRQNIAYLKKTGRPLDDETVAALECLSARR